MRHRRGLLPVLLLIVVGVGLAWWMLQDDDRGLPLTVVNHSGETARVVLYGQALPEAVLIESLATGMERRLLLRTADGGALRVRVTQSRADVASQLVADIAQLNGPQRLTIERNNRYLLEAATY